MIYNNVISIDINVCTLLHDVITLITAISLPREIQVLH